MSLNKRTCGFCLLICVISGIATSAYSNAAEARSETTAKRVRPATNNVVRIQVARRQLDVDRLPRVRQVSHSGLVLTTENGETYLLEYMSDAKTHLNKVKINVKETKDDHQIVQMNGWSDTGIKSFKWTLQKTGSQLDGSRSARELQGLMQTGMNGYSLVKFEQCHTAQQRLRNYLGILPASALESTKQRMNNVIDYLLDENDPEPTNGRGLTSRMKADIQERSVETLLGHRQDQQLGALDAALAESIQGRIEHQALKTAGAPTLSGQSGSGRQPIVNSTSRFDLSPSQCTTTACAELGYVDRHTIYVDNRGDITTQVNMEQWAVIERSSGGGTGRAGRDGGTGGGTEDGDYAEIDPGTGVEHFKVEPITPNN
jgi:hypothetical protein